VGVGELDEVDESTLAASAFSDSIAASLATSAAATFAAISAAVGGEKVQV
jgi:hypothetical protein